MGTHAVAALLLLCWGAVASGQIAGTVYPTYQHKEAYTTTGSPISTAISLSPQTSVSVQHTIVRNKPAYPFPYTDKKSEASDETSYYYTYDDSSEERGKISTTPFTTTTPGTTTKKPRSFWSSQKAQLDARRKETSQKFLTSYNRPTVRPSSENRPKVEFKVREKPKFGLSNKNNNKEEDSNKREWSTTTPSTSTQKSFKFSYNEANLAEEKLSGKEEIKVSKGVENNQIVGRLGDIPVQNNAQILAPTVAPSPNVKKFGGSRQNNFDSKIQPSLRNSYGSQSSLGNQQLPLNQDQILLDVNKQSNTRPQQAPTNPEEFLMSLTKQQPLLNLNQQLSNQRPLQNFQQQQLNNNNQQRLNNPPLLNLNQMPSNQQQFINSNPLPPQQTLLNTNLLPQQNPTNLLPQQNPTNNSPFRAFISTSPNTASRPAEAYTNTNGNQLQSTFLQRLGALGVNLANAADSSRSGLLVARDGGYGGGQGLTFNLGPVADPLQILLKLLSLLPRPLLDLNGRLFFGIELGKNAGLVSGAGPVHKPLVG